MLWLESCQETFPSHWSTGRFGRQLGSHHAGRQQEVEQSHEVRNAPTDQASQKLDQAVKTDVPAFNQAVKALEVPAIEVRR
jgi:hypothetical protein